MNEPDKNLRLDGAVAEAVELIEIDRIRADIEYLCQAPRHSGTNLEFHRKSAEYVSESLRVAGCVVQQQKFTVPSEPEPRPGLNVVGTLEAETEGNGPAAMVGAHYDTVPGSPGADDNASGVAVMLECARVLSKIDRKRLMLFVSFDAEERQPEVGLHGSTAFVQNLVASSEPTIISAAYILEMVGYSASEGGQKVPPGLQLVFPRAFDRLANSQFSGDSVVVISNGKSRNVSRQLEEASRSVQGGVPILPIEIPRWMPVPHNLRRSDHAPFWKAGIPAVMIGDTANFRNPNYHAATDTPETLDYQFIASVARTLIATVAIQVTSTVPQRKPRVKLR